MKKNKQKIRKNSQFLDNYGIVLVYFFSFLSLVFSVIFNRHWIILISIALSLSYDIWFRYIRKGLWCEAGRSYEGTIESIRAASQYTSFFLAFIAISLSVAINIPLELKELFSDFFIKCYGFIILSFSGLVLLFIPIPYLSKGKINEPSIALKNCFFIVLFMEKTIILLLVYLIIQIFITLNTPQITIPFFLINDLGTSS